MNKYNVLLSLLFVSFAAQAARLPTSVIPKHYAITIAPDLVAETFRGEETIDVDVTQATPSITMHGIGFTYHDVTVTSAGEKTATANVTEDAKNEMIVLRPAKPLAKASR